MTELLDALHFAHEAGIIHRDVKPANIMIDAGGHAKLTDFGVARFTEPQGDQIDATRVGTIIGTPSYMSPEQIQGQPIDRRSDLFSAGIIFYQLLTWQKPFQGTQWELAKKIIEDDPPWPSKLVEIPADIDRIVARAMAKQRERRYETARSSPKRSSASRRASRWKVTRTRSPSRKRPGRPRPPSPPKPNASSGTRCGKAKTPMTWRFTSSNSRTARSWSSRKKESPSCARRRRTSDRSGGRPRGGRSRLPSAAAPASLQRAMASGQRGWKWQPVGGDSGEGISPTIGLNWVLRVSRRGTCFSSAWV